MDEFSIAEAAAGSMAFGSEMSGETGSSSFDEAVQHQCEACLSSHVSSEGTVSGDAVQALDMLQQAVQDDPVLSGKVETLIDAVKDSEAIVDVPEFVGRVFAMDGLGLDSGVNPSDGLI